MKIKNESFISILLIVAFFVGVFFLVKNTDKTARTDNTQNQQEDTMPLILTEEDHFYGNRNSNIVIVEYSDTECPFCKVFHETMKRVIAEKGNEIAWVYRHFPVKSRSFKESLATECAYEQKGDAGFWQFINTIYQITPSNDGLEPQELYNIANQIGLDPNQFNNCMTNETYSQKIYGQMASGDFLKVEGTPTSFILVDGIVVDTILGAQDYNTVMAKINSVLK